MSGMNPAGDCERERWREVRGVEHGRKGEARVREVRRESAPWMRAAGARE
jgi:hypothetical protein